ncbi:MAG: competence type IV pilus minor pilin ComGD [Vagococcus sp.]|uniref:competence type IV pilus minor pilin ComGD n=1 Tax=Vagococcus sp. TaxID=1933889 RepID=UPI002FC7304B
MNKKEYEGFTLIESLLVLLTITIFITVPLISLKRWKEKTKVEMFLSQLERRIQQTHQSAILEQHSTKISQVESENYFKFEYYHHGVQYRDVLYVEEPLNLRTTDTIEFIHNTGNLKVIQGIRIEDNLNKRNIIYSFQLGSGKVIRREEKK